VVSGRGPVIRFVKRCFPNPQYLLKAHLDFLMMTGLLFVFFLVFEHLRLTPPMAIMVAMTVGSMGDPSGFLALALKPDLAQKPTTPFGAVMVLSFTATTVGYGAPRGTWRTPSSTPLVSDLRVIMETRHIGRMSRMPGGRTGCCLALVLGQSRERRNT